MSDEKSFRRIGEIEMEIDRDLCVGFEDCIVAAPEAFELDEEGIAVFTNPERETREALVQACLDCPVDAITMRSSEEGHIAP